MDSKSVHVSAPPVNEEPQDRAVREVRVRSRRAYLAILLAKLPPAAAKVWLALAFHAKRKHSGFIECFPGMGTLEKITGLSRRTISRAIDHLATIAWVRVRRTRTSNCYLLTDSAPDISKAFGLYITRD